MNSRQINPNSLIWSEMVITCIADSHELHRELDPLRETDILIHAGDWTMFSRSLKAIADFNDWLEEQHVRHGIVLVPGNHEAYLEADPIRRSFTDNGTVLIGKAITINGLKIWGSPVTPLYGGAFGLSNPIDRARHYAQIPADTDVLVTHSPPFGILDRSPGQTEHAGCRELLKAVERIKPKIHIFGHVHGGYGIYETADTTFVNAALLGPDGALQNPPIHLRIKRIDSVIDP
jgi:Icc-related predicted phosphoesterase